MFRNIQAWFAHKALTPWKTTISSLFKIIWLNRNESHCNLLGYNTVQSWKVQLSSIWLYRLGKDRQLNKSSAKLMKWQQNKRDTHTQICCMSHGRMNKMIYLFRSILTNLYFLIYLLDFLGEDSLEFVLEIHFYCRNMWHTILYCNLLRHVRTMYSRYHRPRETSGYNKHGTALNPNFPGIYHLRTEILEMFW